MIEGFKRGKTYKWLGPKDFNDNWNNEMERWKDGEPRICLEANLSGTMAAFSGIGDVASIETLWEYEHVLDFFVEVHKEILNKNFEVILL